MKKLIVPKSVRRRAAIDKAFYLLKFAIMLAIAYVVADYVYRTMMVTNFGNVSTTVFLIMIIPFFVCKFPGSLIDSDFVGEIISIETKNNTFNYNEGRRIVPKISQYALVRTEKGKLHTMPIFDQGELAFGRRKMYSVGTKVLHVYGCEHLRPLNLTDKEKPIICVVCGYNSPADSECCQNCGCSLDIKVVDKEKK